MSKIMSASIAAACALGASVAMISPAAAVGTATATYNCGAYGSAVVGTFTRTAPTVPATKNLAVVATISFTSPAPILPNAASAVFAGAGLTLTNPNVIPAGPNTSIKLSGASPATLASAPTGITISVAGVTVNCAQSGPVSGWGI